MAKSQDEIQRWLNRIEIAKAWRKPYEEVWKRNIGYHKGKYITPDVNDGDDQVCVNLVHSHIRVIVPAIYSRNPDVVVKSRRSEYNQAAICLQEVVRYLQKELNIKAPMKQCILDALLCARGWIKQGYQTEFVKTEEKLPFIEKLLRSMGEKLGREKKEPTTYAIEPDERIVSESTWVRRVSPFNMIVPALSVQLEELPWIGEERVVSLADVKKNPNFKNTSGLTASTDVIRRLKAKEEQRFGGVSADIEGDDDLSYVSLYELWDARENVVFTIAEGYDKYLEEPKENVYSSFLDSRHTYTSLCFNEVVDEFYPLTDIEAWEPQIHELNTLRTRMSRSTRRAYRKYIAKQASFAEEELRKLQSSEDMAIAVTTADTLADSIQALQDTPLPQDLYKYEAIIKADIDRVSGVSEYQRGSLEGSADSATEAAIVNTQSRLGIDERLSVVGDFANRISRNLGMIAQKFMSQEQIIKIVGEKIGSNWATFEDDEDIKREFLFEIVYGSSAPINREVKKQQSVSFYQLARDDPYWDQIKIRLDLAREIKDIQSPEEYLNPKIVELMEKRMLEQAATPSILGPDGKPARPGGSQSGQGPGVPSPASLQSGMARTGQPHQPGGRGGQIKVPSPV